MADELNGPGMVFRDEESRNTIKVATANAVLSESIEIELPEESCKLSTKEDIENLKVGLKKR